MQGRTLVVKRDRDGWGGNASEADQPVQVALGNIVEASIRIPVTMIVGVPLRVDHRLFNCAVVVYRGRILGIVPKSYLPNYREFYERRWFARAAEAPFGEVQVAGQLAPFGADLVFDAENVANFALHVEVCEDVWTPIPPSSWAALAGATVLANLSASNITVGKAEYRRDLCAGQSGRCVAAYLYSAAGPGESTTDLAWDGHALIYENNELLAESERFAATEQISHSRRVRRSCDPVADSGRFSMGLPRFAPGSAERRADRRWWQMWAVHIFDAVTGISLLGRG